MSSKVFKACIAFALLILVQNAALSAEPTTHDVYVLASAGRVQEAKQLMQQVLRDHPNSWKAHFVEAELLAKQNQFAAARAELATAERLSPGLTAESPEAVRKLRAQISGVPSNSRNEVQRATNAPAFSPAFSWGPILVVGLVLIIVVMMIRSFMRRAATQATNSMPMGNSGMFGSGAQQPMGGGFGGGGGLMGSLATGAALGAGLVAGEALAHKLVDGDEPHRRVAQDNFGDTGSSFGQNSDQNLDMGGNDFGISDSSSWDSGGGDSGGGWE